MTTQTDVIDFAFSDTSPAAFISDAANPGQLNPLSDLVYAVLNELPWCTVTVNSGDSAGVRGVEIVRQWEITVVSDTSTTGVAEPDYHAHALLGLLSSRYFRVLEVTPVSSTTS